ncbi:MAG: hypothetical protein AAF065_15245 [Verrucomicrobiota bacterium]
MKTVSVKLLTILTIAGLLSGCATKRYGRMTSLTGMEKDVYDCKDIALEISKVEKFILEVNEGAEVDFMSVAGFLGDFGIGNSIEKDKALKSANERLEELKQLKIDKDCDGVAVVPKMGS